MFRSLEGCGGTMFESPVVGSEGAPSLSCYFAFVAPTLGSEFSVPLGCHTIWGRAGSDPAPPPRDPETPEEPEEDPPTTDPGG